VFTFVFEQGSSLSTVLAVTAVSILLAGVFYYRAFGMLRAMQWQLLLALRAVAIVIIILLLFRPVLSYHKDLQQKPALVFLIDRSGSMSIADDTSGLNRFTLAKMQLEKWWPKLQPDFALYLVEFSETANLLPGGIADLDKLAPDGKATSLSRALIEPRRLPNLSRKDIEAVILLSDGIHNTKRSPLEILSQLGMTVHTIGVGASLRSNPNYRDIQVTGIDCPEQLLLKNKATITAGVEAIGLGGYVTKVLLEEDGQQVAESELTLDDIEGSQKVSFEYTPTVKGRHTYTVRVPPAAQEKVVENNHRSAIAQVVEPGIRVLYIEGTLRGEYGALVENFLSKDPDLEFCSLIQTRKNEFLQRTNMQNLDFKAIPNKAEEINKFDVFIFGDLDVTYIRAEQQEMIVKRVQEGGGLVMLGGYHSLGPGGYEGTPLGKILPMRLGNRDIGQVTDPFLPMLTPEGTQHPIFTNIAGFFPTARMPAKIAGLPALNGCTRVEGARPGASVLASHPTEVQAMPVLAVQPVGKGRTAVFTADTTRYWHQIPMAREQQSPFLQFWGQMVRWLAGRSTTVENKASVTASTDKAFYEPDDAVQITAIVRDQKGEGAASASVVAKIKEPSGRPAQVALSATTGGTGGHYTGVFEPREPGRYQIMVEAKVADELVKIESPLLADVSRPNLEFEKLDMDEKMLTRIASDTGGRYMHITTADHLLDQLDRTQRKKKLYFEKPLYWPPLFWLLFVASLTTEWVLRKRFQLR
jgi:uncharacterized membrane protein